MRRRWACSSDQTAAFSRTRTFELMFCALLLLGGIPPTLSSDPDLGARTNWDTVLLPVLLVPFLIRRRDPLAAAAAFPLACVITAIPTFDQFRLVVAVPVALAIVYPLARDTERRGALAGLALILAGMVVLGLTDIAQRDNGGIGAMIAFSFPLFGGVWGLGRVVRSRDAIAAQLADQSERLVRRREETAALAVEVERTRVASELDLAARDRVREIVALARAAVPGEPAKPVTPRDMFARIERLGREALNEMRGLLGVLRSDERTTTRPPPTLAQIETLLAEARSGGRLVSLEIQGERRPLPDGVELAAYRTVQHALVAIRGAEGTPVTVALRYRPGALELEVRGLPIPGGGADAAMAAARERIRAHGGSFQTENPREGRRALFATIPLAVANA